MALRETLELVLKLTDRSQSGLTRARSFVRPGAHGNRFKRGASDYSHYAVLKSYCSKARGRTRECIFATLWREIIMQKARIKHLFAGIEMQAVAI